MRGNMVLKTLKLLFNGYKNWTPRRYQPYAYGQVYEDMFYQYINYVYIVFNNVMVKGSFYCTKNWCEIRGRCKNMIVPIKNVEFYRKTVTVEEVDFDNNHIGKGTIENHIIVILKKYSLEDIERWKNWKLKKRRK